MQQKAEKIYANNITRQI